MINGIYRFIGAVERRIEDIPSPTLQRAVAQLGHCAIAQKNNFMLASRDLARTNLAQAAQKARKNASNRRLQYGGVVQFADGRKMKGKREEAEIEKQKRSLKLRENRLAKKRKEGQPRSSSPLRPEHEWDY